MKRWLCSLLLAVGVIFLLRIPHHSVHPHLHLQATGDRSALCQNEFVSTWCRAVQAANPASPLGRASPSELFATKFGFVITDIAEDGVHPGWTIEGRQVLTRVVIKTWLPVATLLTKPAA